MGDLETINALVNAGTSVIFLWLFWMERKRSSELSDQRVGLLKECNETLIRVLEGKQETSQNLSLKE